LYIFFLEKVFQSGVVSKDNHMRLYYIGPNFTNPKITTRNFFLITCNSLRFIQSMTRIVNYMTFPIKLMIQNYPSHITRCITHELKVFSANGRMQDGNVWWPIPP